MRFPAILKEAAAVLGRVSVVQIASEVSANDRTDGRRCRAITGSAAAFTIRPEKIRLAPLEEHPTPEESTATGVVREVVYVGAFTRYTVDLDGGGELVVMQQNLTMSSMEVLQARGQRVRLIWERQHNRAIAQTGESVQGAQEKREEER